MQSKCFIILHHHIILLSVHEIQLVSVLAKIKIKMYNNSLGNVILDFLIYTYRYLNMYVHRYRESKIIQNRVHVQNKQKTKLYVIVSFNVVSFVHNFFLLFLCFIFNM